MFSEETGRAINRTMMLGAATAVLLYLLAPPVAFWALAWALEPRTGVAPGNTFWFILAIWCGCNAAYLIWDGVAGLIKSKRSDRRHKEFMALRARFYASNEVCTESLESLRNRAGLTP